MKLGIMQPYFFPYLGYFDLINRTDRWIVFDVVKYHPKSWMNRNRILHPATAWQFITVPVHRHEGEGLVKDVLIVDRDKARQRILGQMEHYRVGRAPHFAAVQELVRAAFSSTSSNRLCDLNIAGLRVVCEYVGLAFNFSVLSEMGLELPAIKHPGAWALEVSAAVNASAYVNPPGGRHLFRKEEFEERKVDLQFTELVDFRYATGSYDFVERLSIIDVLMWNEPQAVKRYLSSLSATR